MSRWISGRATFRHRSPRVTLKLMKNAFLGAALAVALTTVANAQQLPRPASPLVVQTLDKKTIDLQQYKGKYVIVSFLLTT